MTTRLPIGLRLTLYFLVLFTTTQLIFGLGMWITLKDHLYDIADDTLEDRIDDVSHFLSAQPQEVSVADLKREVANAYVLEHAGEYLQIQAEHGEWIYRSTFFQKNNVGVFGELQKPLYEDRKISGRSLRFLAEILEVRGRRYIVQAAIPEGDILGTLHSFRRNLVLSAFAILVLAAVVGSWLSRQALAPVDAIIRAARNINAGNLNSRLEKLNTGDELQRLSDTLNEMLGRIDAAFQRVSQFTADASHELRTPISLMRTEAEIALRKSRDEGEYQEALRHILVEAERTSILIEKLLSLARVDSGRESLPLRRLDLRQVLRDVAADWRQPITANHRFVEDLGGGEVSIAGDRLSLVRLLNILLDNAVKYTPPGGTIELALSPIPGQAVLAVKDSGIGISDNDLPRIFERFYRADKARSRESGGVGLGLAIAQWIVEQHKGSIRVTSIPGEGSQFLVFFPLGTG